MTAPAGWLSRVDVARALGCSRTHARALLRPHEHLAQLRDGVMVWTPSVLALLDPGVPHAAPGELNLPHTAARLRVSPGRLLTLLRDLDLHPVPRRLVGLRVCPHLTPVQIDQVAARLRGEPPRRAGPPGWLTLTAAARCWDVSLSAAADRLWPHYDRALPVAPAAGAPRELWWPPEVITAC